MKDNQRIIAAYKVAMSNPTIITVSNLQNAWLDYYDDKIQPLLDEFQAIMAGAHTKTKPKQERRTETARTRRSDE